LLINNKSIPVVFAPWMVSRVQGQPVVSSRAGASSRRHVHTAGYTLTCVFSALVLVASGLSYFVVRDVSSIGSSHAITGGPSIGAQNILLMGLESRRDWNGNILPARILNHLHAGSVQGVALILLHIPAGGKKAIGFSIPRDDWVNFAGAVGSQQQGKVDQAYGVSMFYQQQQLKAQNPNITQNQLAFQGNEAGRKAAVDTVEQLTGVHIDHFAEVNLDGFYELANVLGGVEVCLKHPVQDANSGANFPAGYQHLNGAQALAFVRQRDGLPNGDLDRTHRQQAFLDTIMEQLRTEGVIGDLTKINALLSVARQYVITDSDWNLLDFASQMQSLTSGNLVFHTLPIQGYATIDGQAANQVDPVAIKNIVQSTFYPKPVTPSTAGTQPQQPGTAAAATTVDVLNGGGMPGLASRVSGAMVQAGFKAGGVGNTTLRTATQVLYGAGEAANASRIASAFGVTSAASATVAANHIEVLIGSATTSVPTVSAAPAAGSSASGSASSSPSSVIPTSGPQGGAVGAQKGIPCVD
jgi:LCP family protein required for cell wall assembly